MSTVRCPKGVESACFYRKHPSADMPGIRAITVSGNAGVEETYYYIDDARGLLSEVQMNTLEFHPWGSRIDALERPDIMVFDLDPDEGMALDAIRLGVRDLKGLLDQQSLVSYLKTSGGKGYHVVIPFQPTASWDAFHAFAQHIAKTMEATWPQRYTSNPRKNRRGNRIFIDWMRNSRGATSVAPYSVRAREGAPVSMPIAWDALDAVSPHEITLADALSRIEGEDPWTGFFQRRQTLKA